MPNIASLLKAEITRLARKEARAATQGLKKAVAAHRTEIAALKRRTIALEQALRRAQRGTAGTNTPQPTQEASSATGLRFSAKGLAAQRHRLGLSAHDLGRLVGASGQSVYNWEAGKARPRTQHMPAIAAVRTLGKRSAAAALASLPPQR
jgi:DNA-binding transcriptional regulator YiaG